MTCVSSVGIIKSKKTMMKKEYVKPALVVEEILLESYMTSTSGMPVPGDESDEAGANDRRGSWGDFWN